MSKLFKVFGGKKIVAYLVTMIIGMIKARFPSLPLPSDDFLTDLVLGFFAAHTLTDVAHMSLTAWREVLAGKAAKPVGQGVP